MICRPNRTPLSSGNKQKVDMRARKPLKILEKIICIAQDKPFICVVTKSIRKGLIEHCWFNKTFSYGFSILNDVFEDSIMKTMLTMPQLSKKEAENIAVCYDKLWKLMIDKRLTKHSFAKRRRLQLTQWRNSREMKMCEWRHL